MKSAISKQVPLGATQVPPLLPISQALVAILFSVLAQINSAA
jgi:hypothetical protein